MSVFRKSEPGHQDKIDRFGQVHLGLGARGLRDDKRGNFARVAVQFERSDNRLARQGREENNVLRFQPLRQAEDAFANFLGKRLSIFRSQLAQAVPHFLPQGRFRRWALIHVRKIVGSNFISLTARWKVSIPPTSGLAGSKWKSFASLAPAYMLP